MMEDKSYVEEDTEEIIIYYLCEFINNLQYKNTMRMTLNIKSRQSLFGFV